ncbi:MAG: efflux RND transporter periplasmic adaptor subunit [Deltaproteobacteria bacterium]|jgi:RND family efflux transporter MFP subunit|nr:efflux RND transporter periplasmic adaptor subunit [Deltaproteobacteria bacterium]MCL5880887.1 efflux RND transporter periplasmic adaptor subunit [Deltaproteobacteria bacterium]MDA8303730.1 efflux RND transporter periplasmic adaptor subunit [Deltaproteobacteria bacterium]
MKQTSNRIDKKPGKSFIIIPALIIIVFISVLSLTACGKRKVSVKIMPVVTTSRVKIMSAKVYLKEPGYFLPYKTADIASRSAGQVIRVIARDGNYVKAGQVLAIIDRKKAFFTMKSQESAVKQAKAALFLAKSTLGRDAMLFKKQLLTALDYDTAVSNYKKALASYNAGVSLLNLDRKDYRDTLIVSLISGIVYKRYINLGDYVPVNKLAYQVVALKPLELKFYVPQSKVPLIKNFETCFATVKGYSKKIFSGKIYFISPSLNSQTRMVRVKALFQNSRGLIRPQYFADVKLPVGFVRDGLFVPQASVRIGLKGDYLFVYKNGTVRQRMVSTGISKGGYLQVVKGVSKETIVVVKGSNLVHNNEKVTVIK